MNILNGCLKKLKTESGHGQQSWEIEVNKFIITSVNMKEKIETFDRNKRKLV